LGIFGNESHGREGVAEKLMAAMGHFLYLELLFWTARGSFPGAWDTILLILGSRGTPNQWTHWRRDIRFYRFLNGFGGLPGIPFEHKFDIFGDLGLQNCR